MFQLVKVGAAAIGCAALATWAYWNRLVFHVKIYCFSTTFTASENHQHICRIVVSLPDDYKVEKLNEPFPKPVSFKIKRDNIPLEGFYVSEVYNYGTRKLAINVYGCLKTAGVYTLIPVFQNEGKIVFDGENQIEFEVEPSRPCTLKVLEVKRKDDIGSQSRDTLYSGGKAQIFMEAKDEFGNVITDDFWEVEVDSEYVMNPVYEFDGRRNCHVITVDCEKEGQANLNVKMMHRRVLLTTLRKHVDIEIIQAPLSPTDCIISQSENSAVHAGQKLRIEVQLYDIYDEHFQLREDDPNTHKFQLKVRKVSSFLRKHKYLQEIESLKLVSKSSSNVCQLEWIPMVAGQREYTVYYDGASLGKGSAKVTVKPGPLRSIAIVKTSPKAQEDNTCYTSEESKLSIKGLDGFENEMMVNPEQCCLEGKDDGGSPVDFNQTKSANGTILQFTYSFDNKGTYHVNIHNRDQQTDVKVPKPLVIKVSPAPLCHGKCRILQSKEQVVQAGQIIRIKLELYDIYNKPFKLDENDLNTNKFSVIDMKVSKSSELYRQEENSLKVLKSSSNDCQLEWIPMVAGQREYTVSHDGASLGKGSAKVTVNPGPLRSIALVNTTPTAQEDNTFTCYTSEEAKLSIKGLDEFENKVIVDPKQWCLEGKVDGGSPIDLNQIKSSNGTILQFTYSFDNKGTYNVNIHNKDQQTDVKVPKPLVIKVSPAPMCHGKCRILQSKEWVAQAGQIMKLKLKFYDIYGNPFKLDENDLHTNKFSLIDMKVSKSSELDKQEENSLKLSKLGSNVCQLEWIPMVACQREYSVSHNGTSLGNRTAKVTVNPGPLRSIAIVNTIPTTQEDNTFKCYTTEESNLSIKGLDEFENEVIVDPEQWCLEGKDDGSSPVDLNQTKSSNESILQFSYSFDNKGTYNVNIHNRDQQTDVKVPKPLVIKVSPAPMCHGKCRILQCKERVAQAGQIMKLKLKLYDIYDKPFKLDENDLHRNKFSLIDMKVSKSSELHKQEENSLKLLRSSSNVCQLKWIPMVAGQREYTVYYDGTSLGNGTAKVTVNPGPLRSIVIVNTIPTPQEDNTFTCYTSEHAKLSIKGQDEFENEVKVDPEQWFLAVNGNGGSPVDLNQTKSSNETILQFSYSFDNEGTYHVNIQNRDEQSDVKVPESFVLKVIPDPLDHSKCRVERMETEKPVFQQLPMPLKIKLELFNCMSKPFYSSKLEKNALEVKVNGEVSNNIEYIVPNFTDPPNTVYITVDVNTDDNTTNRNVEVYYTRKRLGGYIDIDVTHVLPFSEDDYFYFGATNVNINEVSRKILIGDDYANIDNINRVLNYYTEIRPKDFVVGFDDQVILDLSDFQESQIQKVHKMISLLVEGLHYRTQAYRFNSERGDWKTKSENAYSDGNHLESQECSVIKEKYAELMDEAHMQASEAIFKFFNYARTEKEIDLHGQLVANENLLEEYKKQLCTDKKYNRREVRQKINKAREEMDEAIRHLKRRNVFQEQDGRDWLEIIVGAGHHSQRNVQKIRPKVEKFLEDNQREFKECNKGSLLITYQKYKGNQPCFASFYCKKCDKTWESASSWKRKWQMCFRCDRKGNESKCLPLKLRSKSTSQRRSNYRSSVYTPFTQEDHRRLCQKCQETGKDCSSL